MQQAPEKHSDLDQHFARKETMVLELGTINLLHTDKTVPITLGAVPDIYTVFSIKIATLHPSFLWLFAEPRISSDLVYLPFVPRISAPYIIPVRLGNR